MILKIRYVINKQVQIFVIVIDNRLHGTSHQGQSQRDSFSQPKIHEFDARETIMAVQCTQNSAFCFVLSL